MMKMVCVADKFGSWHVGRMRTDLPQLVVQNDAGVKITKHFADCFLGKVSLRKRNSHF